MAHFLGTTNQTAHYFYSTYFAIIFVLVFPFLFYPPLFLLLFLFEVSPLSLYIPSSSVVSLLLSLTWIFLLPVLTPPHLRCAPSNSSSPSYAITTFQRLLIL